MMISTNFTPANQDLCIHIEGDFVLSLQDQFKNAYENNTIPQKRYVIDMQNVNYLDRAALGMLIDLKEYAKLKSCEVGIVNMQDAVLDIFHVLGISQNFQTSLRANFAEDYLVSFKRLGQ